jgi:hypothetical protein
MSNVKFTTKAKMVFTQVLNKPKKVKKEKKKGE